MPDRDLQYRIGSITKSLTAAVVLGLRDEGRLSLDDPIGRAPAGAPGRRRYGCASCSATPAACSASRTAPGGNGTPAAALADLLAGVTDGEASPSAAYQRFHYSNLGVRAARRRDRAGDRPSRGGTRCRDRLLGPLGMHRTTLPGPRSRSPAATWCIPGTRPCARSPATTPGRWRRPASSGPQWTIWPAGPPRSAGPDRGAVVLLGPTVAEMAAPVVHRRPGRLDQRVRPRTAAVAARRAGATSDTPAPCPGYLAVVAGTPALRHRRGRLRQHLLARRHWASDQLGHVHPGRRARHASRRRRAPWRPAPPPPADVEPLCGRWWWMGREFEAGWDARPVRTGHPWHRRAGRRAVALHRGGRRPLARQHRRAGRRDPGRAARPATARSSTLDIATFVFSPRPPPDAGRVRPVLCPTPGLPRVGLACETERATGRTLFCMSSARTMTARDAPLGAVRDVGTGLAGRHRVLRRRRRRDRRRRGAPGRATRPDTWTDIPLREAVRALSKLHPDEIRLVLPAPGDPRGLPGPGPFTGRRARRRRRRDRGPARPGATGTHPHLRLGRHVRDRRVAGVPAAGGPARRPASPAPPRPRPTSSAALAEATADADPARRRRVAARAGRRAGRAAQAGQRHRSAARLLPPGPTALRPGQRAGPGARPGRRGGPGRRGQRLRGPTARRRPAPAHGGLPARPGRRLQLPARSPDPSPP